MDSTLELRLSKLSSHKVPRFPSITGNILRALTTKYRELGGKASGLAGTWRLSSRNAIKTRRIKRNSELLSKQNSSVDNRTESDLLPIRTGFYSIFDRLRTHPTSTRWSLRACRLFPSHSKWTKCRRTLQWLAFIWIKHQSWFAAKVDLNFSPEGMQSDKGPNFTMSSSKRRHLHQVFLYFNSLRYSAAALFRSLNRSPRGKERNKE